MDLRGYLQILRKGWPVILGFVVLGTAAGVAVTLATTKVYEATVQIFVATSNSSTTTDLAQGNTFTQNRVQSYTAIADSPDVARAVVKRLGLKTSSSELADQITADAPISKVLINIHVTDRDPVQAARLANAVATEFDRVVADVEQTAADGRPVVKLTPIHPATVPDAPIKPNKVLDVALGLLLGLLLGVGLVVVRDLLDTTVKGPEDFEEWDLPVLGLVPYDKRTSDTPVAFRGDPHSGRSEAYRQLRTNMQFVSVDDAPRIIAITSAIPGEGKTTTAINLAAALAEAGFKVVLVETDLRRPNIAKLLGLVPDVGFTTALIGRVEAVDVLQNAGRNLAVLPCGPVPPNPSELLITDQARAILQQISDTADYTIVDTAPLLPVADGAEVAALADATVVVHRAGKSTRDQVARALERLAQVGERPVGAVLNSVNRNRTYDFTTGYYYTYRPDRASRRKGKDKVVAPAAKESSGPRSPDADEVATSGATAARDES